MFGDVRKEVKAKRETGGREEKKGKDFPPTLYLSRLQKASSIHLLATKDRQNSSHSRCKLASKISGPLVIHRVGNIPKSIIHLCVAPFRW